MLPTRTITMPIGVEIGGRSIGAVQLRPASRGYRIEAATSVARSTPGAALDQVEIDRLAAILERQGFRGRQVVLSVPSESLLTALLELPPAESGAPLPQIARSELATTHKQDPAAIESTYWELPEPARPTEGTCVMAVGCPVRDADALLDLFEAAGLVVVGLDVHACALLRACTPLLRQGNGLVAILDFAWTTASLVVISQGVVVYERSLHDSGLERLHRVLVDEIGLDNDVASHVLGEIGLGPESRTDETQRELMTATRDRLLGCLGVMVPEVRMSLGYAAQEYGQSGVDRILMVGEAGEVPGIAEHLASEFNQKVEVVSPADLVAGGGPAPARSPALTTAFGLAQYTSR